MRLCAGAFAAAIVLATAAAQPASSSSQAPPAGATLAALAEPGAPSSLASQRIYFVIPDRYADGESSNDRGGLTGPASVTGYDPAGIGYFHGGDLTGLTDNLQRVRDLGFTAIWITPVVKQQTVDRDGAAYHGDRGLDFTTVDPHLGTENDLSAMVARAHVLGLKVYLDVVVDHTGDVIRLANGSTYSDAPYRDCHGRVFEPQSYVTAKRFPCLTARYMPEMPHVAPRDRQRKKPAWLNDPLNYHDRGTIGAGSCSRQCLEQGDLDGLDDLFTEKPNVMEGLARIYASWIQRFRVDGFRVDTAGHVNAAFFKLWVPRIRAAVKANRLPGDFPIFGQVTPNDTIGLAQYVRDRGLPQVLDFPFQSVASAYAAGASDAKGIARRLEDDDYFRLPDGSDPAFPTFLGDRDPGRGAQQIRSRKPGLSPDALLRHVLLGYDLLYLLRGAPVVMYGDEVGMIGSGGDAAGQDMFPTRVARWQTEARVGSPPIGNGSSFDVTDNPIEAQLKALSSLRDQYRALSTGASVVRYASGPVLVVSRIDVSTGTEVVTAFNNGGSSARVTVQTGTPGSTWTVPFGSGTVTAGAAGRLTLTIPPVSAILARPSGAVTHSRPAAPVLTAGPDPASPYYALTATVRGGPVTVAFAARTAGGAWRRLDVDDSAPYRAFLDPGRYPKGASVQVVAIARAFDGRTSVSRVVTVKPHV